MPVRRTAIAMALAGAAAMGAPAQEPMPQSHDHAHHLEHATMAAAKAGRVPTMPGQDAFGAIQEIVDILEADPATDWSKVDIAALREHLIDMNEVTLHADAVSQPIDGGVRIDVTGTGRTLAAIRRMIPAHARAIDGTNSWVVGAEPSRDGVVLTVTSPDPAQAMKIRRLGFMGVMTQTSHHELHHLAIASGELVH